VSFSFPALLLLLSSPAPAADIVELRQALIGELRALGGDSVGWEASELLLASSVTLRIGATPAGPDGRAATASYAVGKHEITVAETLAREKDAALLARRIAPTVVHELEHARADFAVPGAAVVVEGELTAYAAEAIFLRLRLAADPSYLSAQKELGRLRHNYEFVSRAGAAGLDELRANCENEGVFKGLEPLELHCSRLSGKEKGHCLKPASYFRARLETLRAALKP
jgi:hypothetical protein